MSDVILAAFSLVLMVFVAAMMVALARDHDR